MPPDNAAKVTTWPLLSRSITAARAGGSGRTSDGAIRLTCHPRSPPAGGAVDTPGMTAGTDAALNTVGIALMAGKHTPPVNGKHILGATFQITEGWANS